MEELYIHIEISDKQSSKIVVRAASPEHVLAGVGMIIERMSGRTGKSVAEFMYKLTRIMPPPAAEVEVAAAKPPAYEDAEEREGKQ